MIVLLVRLPFPEYVPCDIQRVLLDAEFSLCALLL